MYTTQKHLCVWKEKISERNPQEVQLESVGRDAKLGARWEKIFNLDWILSS